MYQIYKKLNQYTNARDNNLRIFKKGHTKTKEQNKELAFKYNMWQCVYIVQKRISEYKHKHLVHYIFFII